MSVTPRIVMFGAGDLAVLALDGALAAAGPGSIIGAIVDAGDPAEDAGPGASLAARARAEGIPTRPGPAGTDDVASAVAVWRPDLLLVCDCRSILPPALIDAAPLGGVNLHPSLLPRYRGRAPVNWAILRGEREIGLTAHVLEPGVDTGPILEQVVVPLAETEDVGDALERLRPLYRAVTARVVAAILGGTARPRPQRHEEATVFPRRRPADGRIDWTQPARAVRDLVRAVARPYPGAFTDLPDGRRMIIWRAAIADRVPDAAPGTIIEDGAATPVIRCGTGGLRVIEHQLCPVPETLSCG